MKCFPKPRVSNIFTSASHQRSFHAVSSCNFVEEETLPAWQTDRNYPARIDEVLNDRYRIVGKLGFGMSSTVWLCRDLRQSNYHVVKICTRNASRAILNQSNKEVQVLQQLNALHSDHPGRSRIRSLQGTFDIHCQRGDRYSCLLHRPLGISMSEFTSWLGGTLPLDVLKGAVVHILLALDFLHSEAKIVHTDMQANNILLDLKDISPLTEYEQVEGQSPSPRKCVDDRIIFKSRTLRPSSATLGLPVLVDFGEARDARSSHRDEIMPDVYRAPEVVIDAPWDLKVDIWNLGVLIWTLFEGESLFVGLSPKGKLSNAYHLAEMIALLGPASASFVATGDLGLQYFNQDGSWKGTAEVPQISLEQREKMLVGKEKESFLRFLRRMLQWDPVQRPTAKELIYDDFLFDQYSKR